MNAQKYIKEFRRICKKHQATAECLGCPFSIRRNGAQIPCYQLILTNPEEAEDLIKRYRRRELKHTIKLILKHPVTFIRCMNEDD